MNTNTDEIIAKMLAHIASECTAINPEERFDAMLDECYSFEDVGGPFQHMTPSRVLREMDPTAHRCGVNDYADGEDWIEVGEETYESDAVNTARDEFVSELKSNFDELASEIEDMREDEEIKASEIVEKVKMLDAMRAEIEACENYRF